jgi:DNA-binding transcriptional regulator YiaG
MGGRAYGWWQSLPKARRRQLLINGEPVAEPDFEQMHASILYGERGLRLEGDAYETGEFPRDFAKLAFNVALNAKSFQGAIAALMNKPNWPLSGRETARLLEVLKRRHAPIADDLHSNKGIRLMHLDSEITLKAVRECSRADIPALPVHDSMLTPQRHEGRVAEIMEKSAASVLGTANPCRVRTSRHSVPHMPSPPLPSLFLPPVLSSASCSKAPQKAGQLDLFALPAETGFSSQIRALRDRLGLSQRQLGERLGCRQPHIANVERGRDRLGDWPRRRLHDLMREEAA